jgi:hypothetical protein
MTAIVILLIVIILLMFKPIRMLVGILFLIGVVGYFSNKGDKEATAAAPKSAPVALAAVEEPKKQEEPKPPPPTPRAGEAVGEEFFNYIHPETAYVCAEAVKRIVKYNIRSPGALWGTNDGDSAFFLLRMSRWSKKVAADGTILLAGDEAEAQNGFGNWAKINYTCTIDPVSKTAKRATLDQGRLQR